MKIDFSASMATSIVERVGVKVEKEDMVGGRGAREEVADTGCFCFPYSYYHYYHFMITIIWLPFCVHLYPTSGKAVNTVMETARGSTVTVTTVNASMAMDWRYIFINTVIRLLRRVCFAVDANITVDLNVQLYIQERSLGFIALILLRSFHSYRRGRVYKWKFCLRFRI